jgi:hypothetical protein
LTHPFCVADDQGFYFANLVSSTTWRVKWCVPKELGYLEQTVETKGRADEAVQLALIRNNWE